MSSSRALMRIGTDTRLANCERGVVELGYATPRKSRSVASPRERRATSRRLRVWRVSWWVDGDVSCIRSSRRDTGRGDGYAGMMAISPRTNSAHSSTARCAASSESATCSRSNCCARIVPISSLRRTRPLLERETLDADDAYRRRRSRPPALRNDNDRPAMDRRRSSRSRWRLVVQRHQVHLTTNIRSLRPLSVPQPTEDPRRHDLSRCTISMRSSP